MHIDEQRLARTLDLLHDAAERVQHEAGSVEMDTLALAGAAFLHESKITDEAGRPVPFDVENATALGYGIMLGWLARESSHA